MAKKNADKRYAKDHEWVVLDGDIATVGITDHAQEQLGDVVHVELPELDRIVTANEACAVVESVKAASDVYAPLAGTVVDIASWRLTLLVDQPAAGTAILAVEGKGDPVSVSIWSYLYGTEGAAAAARDEPRWAKWLSDRALVVAEDHD